MNNESQKDRKPPQKGGFFFHLNSRCAKSPDFEPLTKAIEFPKRNQHLMMLLLHFINHPITTNHSFY